MIKMSVAIIALLSTPIPVLAQQAAEQGGFVVRQGADTLTIEKFSRIGDTIRGSIAARRRPRIDYVLALGGEHAISAIRLAVYAYAAAPGASPLQRIEMLMQGDSASVAVDGAPRMVAVAKGAVPVLNGSIAASELFTARARAAGVGAETPMWLFPTAIMGVASVNLIGRDSMTVTIAGQQQRLRVDSSGRILGGSIAASFVSIGRVDAAVAATLAFHETDYTEPAGAPYHAIDVRVPGQGGISLAGTLTVPIGSGHRWPVVVTIAGSGLHDRDGSIAIIPGGYRPFRQIADSLGRRGIAVLRLDKRGVGMSGGRGGTSADFADDIRAAIAFLRARPEIDSSRIALVGHSEGGWIAPMVAADMPQLKGIVLLAGPGKSGRENARDQWRDTIAAFPGLSPQAREAALVRAMAGADSAAAVDPWSKFYMNYDPLPTAARVRVPVLILQGATDHQVSPGQADTLAAAIRSGGNRDVTVRIFPNLNHLFLYDTDGRASGYTKLTHNLLPQDLVGSLADWLVVRLAR